jgi:N-acetylglutamate synthase
MLGPQDVGFRVVVRHFVGLRDGRPLFTDVLGELLRFTDAELTIPLRAVIADKRIPGRSG